MSDKIAQAVLDAAPSVPPPVIAGMTLCGVALSDWVLFATLLYTVILILNNLETLFRKVKGWCKRDTRN